MTYNKIPLGIYIYDTDGQLTLSENWNAANNSKAVGVYVCTENSKFIIAPTYIESSAEEWGVNGIVSGIITTEDTAIAKHDYAGEANTDKIIAQLGSGNAPAAESCRNYTFKNGKKGYLWSFGEAYDAYKNKNAIVEAMEKIGGRMMQRTDSHWTSTQASSVTAWDFDWAYSNNSTLRSKDTARYVRPVCSI